MGDNHLPMNSFSRICDGGVAADGKFSEVNSNLQVLHFNHEMDSKSLPFLLRTLLHQSHFCFLLELGEYCKIGYDEVSKWPLFIPDILL